MKNKIKTTILIWHQKRKIDKIRKMLCGVERTDGAEDWLEGSKIGELVYYIVLYCIYFLFIVQDFKS